MASSKKAPAKTRKKLTYDSWENATVGFGGERDKIAGGRFYGNTILDDQQLSDLYYHDDVAARIVETRPRESLRKGYSLEAKQQQKAEELQKYANSLGLNEKIVDARIWANLYGGAAIIWGAEDGRSPDKPLRIEGIKRIAFLNVVDRRYLFPRTYYSDPMQPNYGEVETYNLMAQPFYGSPSRPNNEKKIEVLGVIHESRMTCFTGTHVDRKKKLELRGWSYSVLQRVYDKMRAFATALQAAGILLTDASQGVFKIDGLIEQIASGEMDALTTRMQLVDMSRSVSRAIMLDAEKENFEKVATNFSGIPDLLDKFMQVMASAADLPITILMSQAPAGLNATGDTDFRHFYDSVMTDQLNVLKPKLLRAYEILAASKDGPGKVKDLDICFNALWQPTDQEQATLANMQAQTDAVYISSGVTSAEAVAIARFGSGKWSPRVPEVDVDALKEIHDAKMQKKAEDPTGEKAAEQAALTANAAAKQAPGQNGIPKLPEGNDPKTKPSPQEPSPGSTLKPV